MKNNPESREMLNAHCRDVIRKCLNIVEQHGDTYVAIHKDDDVDCVILVSVLRTYPLLSIVVADKNLFADRNEARMLQEANDLNAQSVTGWHSICLDDDSVIYMYRQCVWLSMGLSYDDLFWLLKECISEYKDGKSRIMTSGPPTDPVA